MNPYTLRKTLRALRDRPEQPAAGDQPGRVRRRRPADARPSSSSPAGGSSTTSPSCRRWRSRRSRSCSATRPPAAPTCPGMCDYAVLVDEQAKVFLGGPPLVKMATGEEADDEALGGAEMHARVSGLADYFAVDELDAIRIGRADRGAGSTGASSGPAPTRAGRRAASTTPRSCSASRRPTCGCRSTRARCSPGSSTAREFDEFKPLLRHRRWSPAGRGSTATRSGSWPTHRGVLFSEEAQEGHRSSSSWPTRPTRRWCSCRTPPATWSARSTSRAASSRTARR